MSLEGKEKRSFSGKALALVAALAVVVTLLIGTAAFLIVKLSNENADLRNAQALVTAESKATTDEADAKRVKDNKLAAFKQAFEFCRPTEDPQSDFDKYLGTVRLADGGKTISLDGDVPNDYGFTINSCLLERLHAPQSVIAKFDSTKAIDGVRSDSWNDVSAEWTYSPVAGLSAVYELNVE